MARINDEDKDALRQRADLVEIVSAYTQLKRAGANKFKGLCPFHSEKTPSFTIDQALGLYHCWGCGEGGDVYTFIGKIESLPFVEAVEWVARKAGFDLRYEEARPGDAKLRGLKARILEANAAATDFWHDQLLNSPAAAEARAYLEGRGFDREVAERWQLGYAPGWDRLTKHLLAQGFTNEELLAAGLTRQSDRDGSLYDPFRERIIFPTWNLQNEVVGFGARAMGDAQPKYLNTAATPVFSKSHVMFGLNRAKSAIARGQALVVEGYTDVIALHEGGITEAVATNGVALAESHFELLKKFSSRAVLMFDPDDAGAGATERGFGMHQRIGLEVLVAPLEGGRDPAEMITAEGAEAIRQVIASAQPLMEFKLRLALQRLPLDTPEARSKAVREAVTILRWNPDPIARHGYAFTAASLIGIDAGVVQQELAKSSGMRHDRGDGPVTKPLLGHVKVEREMLQLLLLGRVGRDVLAQLTPADFTSGPRRELFDELAGGAGAAEITALAEALSPAARSLFTELSVGADIPLGQDTERLAQELAGRLRVFRLDREIKTRVKTLQEINPLVDGTRHDDLFTELVGLEADRRDLLRQLQETG